MSEAPRPIRIRTRWPWLLGILAVIVVVLVVIFAFTGGFGGTSAATPSSAPASSSSPSTTDAPNAASNGCIAGDARDATMLVAAQKAAPHNTSGSASFAAAFMRWLYRYPNPSAAEVQQVIQRVVSLKDDPAQFAQFVSSDSNRSGGLVPDGQPFYVSTVPGVFHVESSSTTGQPVISVGAGLVTEGALSATLRESTTVTLRWESGGWHVLGAKGTRMTQSLFSIGTAYSGGC